MTKKETQVFFQICNRVHSCLDDTGSFTYSSIIKKYYDEDHSAVLFTLNTLIDAGILLEPVHGVYVGVEDVLQCGKPSCKEPAVYESNTEDKLYLCKNCMEGALKIGGEGGIDWKRIGEPL